MTPNIKVATLQQQASALVYDLRQRINPAYANQRGTESYERRICAEAIEGLIADAEHGRNRNANVILRWQDADNLEVEELKTWQQRLDAFRYERPVKFADVQATMQAEIDDLRAEHAYQLAYRSEVFAELKSLKLKLAEQRMIIFDHEMADYKGEAEMLRAQISEQRRVIESMQPRTIGNVGTSCGEYVECTGRPDAPHGVDLEASFRTGRTVCVCKSWAPGEAS